MTVMAPNAILLSRYKFVRNPIIRYNERLYGRLPISQCKGFNKGAGARSWRRNPTGFLSGACPAQIRRGVQDDAVAVRSRGDRAPAGGLRHRGRDPRLPRRAAACGPPHQDRTAHGGAEGATDLDARPAILP